jgi:D-amino-acid dehydrogenase
LVSSADVTPGGVRWREPGRAVVVGAGMVGLATAWHLQEQGVDVVVVDRDGVAAGASWGNAGWLSPGMVTPLPEPSVLRLGLGAFVNPLSAVYVAPRVDPHLWRFLARFVSNCSDARWRRAATSLREIGRQALDAFDELARGGVTAATTAAPIIAAYADVPQAEGLRDELRALARVDQHVHVVELAGREARSLAPQLSDRVELALRLEGQRYVDPGEFVGALAESLLARGGLLLSGFDVHTLRHGSEGVAVTGYGREPVHGDVVVLASGAWLDDLAAPLGLGRRVRAGRGYSLTVGVDRTVPGPLYFPAVRVACTPYRGALRVTSGMELRDPHAPLEYRWIQAMVERVRPLTTGVDWASVRDPWVGSRPITADGLPIIGATKDPCVYVAGGHGMWGMTLGPVTGRLLAQYIVTGRCPPELVPFDPLR